MKKSTCLHALNAIVLGIDINKSQSNRSFSAISTGLAYLDSALSGGLRRGHITQVAGTAVLIELMLTQLMDAHAGKGICTACIDYTHELPHALERNPNVSFCQPDEVTSLPVLIAEIASYRQDIIMVTLGDAITLNENGRPCSDVDEDLTMPLHKLAASMQGKSTACLVLTAAPLHIPNSTLVLLQSINTELMRFVFQVTNAASAHSNLMIKP